MRVPEKSFEPEATCPLDGVRVVDLSRLVSGNMVGLQLADFGAEVIKIEDPKRGDPLRAWQTNGISAEGVGAVTVDGRMIDVPVVERARLLVEREAAIAAREARMRSLAGG
jgi:hypothetical protein